MTCAIILAAGRSERMGVNKLLLPFAGSTMIARVVDAFLGARVDRVVVVIRPGDLAIRGALAGRPVCFAENPDQGGEMLGSVRCGLRALPDSARLILVSPGDQPSLSPELVGQMLAQFRGGDSKILVPVCGGQRGHPILFAAHLREEILTSYDGLGLCGLLDAHANEVDEWPTPEAAILQDIDTPEDYRHY